MEQTSTDKKLKLTNKKIKSFVYRGGWDVRWDTVIVGLGLRVYPSGKMAFVLSYRFKGKKSLMVLGRFGVLTVEQGRAEANKQLAKLRGGKDPLEEKRREMKGTTIRALIDTYIEDYAKGPRFPETPRKKTWAEDDRRLKQHVPASWKSRRIDAITRADIKGLHGKIGRDRPYEANRLLMLLSVLFKFAVNEGFVADGTPNPAMGIEKFPEEKRDRWVMPEEMPGLAKAIDMDPNVYVRAAIWLYLLTGLRKKELLRAKHTDIDWRRRQLRLPDTKSGKAQIATLSAAAIAIMQAIPKVEGNPYLLPGRKKGHHLVDIDRPWREIRKAANLQEVRIHDLRRTTGSWMTGAGVDLNLIRDALRHADLTTTLTYARLAKDAAREPMEELGRRILEAAGRAGPVAIDGGKA